MVLLVLGTGVAGGAREVYLETEVESVLYTGGVIWTGDPARPWAESFVVRGAAIQAVGTEAQMEQITDSSVPRVDLGGAFVTPGLVDAHAHVMSFGLSLERIDLVGAASLGETLERVEAWARRHREEGRSGWILGRGWDQNDWPEKAFPTRQDLDRVCSDIPVSLNRIDGHALWVNTRALVLAGITSETPDPPGGRIHRDAGGNPTGVLVDTAEDLLQRVVPRTDRETKTRAVGRAVEAMARAGLTGVHDMGMSSEELQIYRDLARERKLGVRIYAAISVDDERLPQVLDQGPDREWETRFRLGMVKIYMDGALGSRGAALIESYSDDPGNRGLLITEAGALAASMEISLRAGFQCAVHAIGDRANRMVLDVWEKMCEEDEIGGGGAPVPPFSGSGLGDRPARVPPVRLEHAQIIHPEDLPRLGSLGVVASMQPTHCTSDMPWAPDRLGDDRLAGAYAWRSLVDAGSVLASGSDFPIESHDPRYGLYAAVTRNPPGGGPGWSPHQRLSREEALVSFTAAPAYASGDLHRLGTLSPGKQADFVVFDTNLVICDPEDILRARTLWTVVDGKTLWLDSEAGFAEQGGGNR